MGNSPSLRSSIQKGQWDTVLKILETQDGADRARTKKYVISNETMSALQLACRYKAPASIIRTLVPMGQPVSASRPGLLTPLHYAVMTRHPSPQVVSILVRAFPKDVAVRSSLSYQTQTPLHMACFNRTSPEIIQLLHDADPTAAAHLVNGRGQTAWQAACTNSWILHPIWRRKVQRIFMELQNRPPVPTGAPSRPPPKVAVVAAAAAAHTQVPPSRPPPPSARNLDSIPTMIVVETMPMIPTAPPDSLREPQQGEGEAWRVVPLDGDEDVCVLCFENKVEMALIPCGHVCLCHACCDDHTLNEFLHRKCPVCRQPFRDSLRIYQAGISIN